MVPVFAIDKRTIKKYLNMNEEKYMEFIEKQLARTKLLDKYEDFVKTRLEDFPISS